MMKRIKHQKTNLVGCLLPCHMHTCSLATRASRTAQASERPSHNAQPLAATSTAELPEVRNWHKAGGQREAGRERGGTREKRKEKSNAAKEVCCLATSEAGWLNSYLYAGEEYRPLIIV